MNRFHRVTIVLVATIILTLGLYAIPAGPITVSCGAYAPTITQSGHQVTLTCK